MLSCWVSLGIDWTTTTTTTKARSVPSGALKCCRWAHPRVGGGGSGSGSGGAVACARRPSKVIRCRPSSATPHDRRRAIAQHLLTTFALPLPLHWKNENYRKFDQGEVVVVVGRWRWSKNGKNRHQSRRDTRRGKLNGFSTMKRCFCCFASVEKEKLFFWRAARSVGRCWANAIRTWRWQMMASSSSSLYIYSFSLSPSLLFYICCTHTHTHWRRRSTPFLSSFPSLIVLCRTFGSLWCSCSCSWWLLQ